MGLEKIIRRLARRAGIDIKRYRATDTEHGRVVAMLATHKITTVLDVGANIGQYALALRETGYLGDIVSFEPLPAAHQKLAATALKDPAWQVAPRMALGSRKSTATLNIAGNSVSSSLRPMLAAHAEAAISSAYVGHLNVAVERLDAVVGNYIDDSSKIFLKIDTQGFEDEVLDGATALLPRIAGIQIELSLVPLYDGQRLYEALLERMRALGYELWGLSPGFFDARTGRLLQFDGVFFRTSSATPTR